MSDVNKLSTSKKVLDLSGIYAEMKTAYGYDAPSYMTLRRWAAKGLLTSSERLLNEDNPQKRKFYSLSAVVKIFLARPLVKKNSTSLRGSSKSILVETEPSKIDGESQLTGEAFSASPKSMSELNSRMELILDSVAVLSNLVSEQGKVLTQLVDGVARIDAVRKMLMNKYDASSASQSEINEMLRNKAKTLEKGVDVERAILQLSGRIGQLTDLMQRGA
jgi:hypothetical protein